MRARLAALRAVVFWMSLWLAGDASPAAGQGWQDGRSYGPFVCRADFSLAGEQPLFDDLQRLQTDLTRMLAVSRPRERVELYLFQDEVRYRQFLDARFPDLPPRRAMFVKGAGPGMVYAFRGPDFLVDVRHETTHALLHAGVGTIPLWLDEGLAEYFEIPAEERAFESPYLPTVRWDARFGRIATLAALESKQDAAEMGRDEYRHAWAWVHFMLHGPPDAREELLGYLADLRVDDVQEPLSRRLERRLGRPQRLLAEHFKRWGR